MNEMNSTDILDYMKTVGVTTSSDLNGSLSRFNYKTGMKNKIESSMSKHEKERNKSKMKVNQLTCVGCIHSNVCKYKESMEKLQEGLKVFIGNLSPEEEKESGCNINISCDYYSNTYNTITLPYNPIINTPGDPIPFRNDIDCVSQSLNSDDKLGDSCTAKNVPFTRTY